MQTDPVLVGELRTLFKSGATPSALIRVIAERHAGESQLDRVVRAYFREAFAVPMLRVTREHVEHIVQGGDGAWLNSRVVHQMVAARVEWDAPADGAPRAACWLDGLTAADESATLRDFETRTAAEPPAWWDKLDEAGQRDIARTAANAQSLYERVQVLAALAERLQQQLHAVEVATARAG